MNPKTHTLSVLVEDKPGVLARIAALFSRRGFNIESLAVGATEQKDMSRMTIVVSAESTQLEQITKQLNKLINVIKIIEQDDDNSVARELALIKVRADAGNGAYGSVAGNAVRGTGVVTWRWADAIIFAKEDSGNIETSFRDRPKAETRIPEVFCDLHSRDSAFITARCPGMTDIIKPS